MIQFFKDAELTRPVTDGNPVWIFASKRGSVKRVSLWLADVYSTFAYAAAAAGDTQLLVSDGSGLAASGTVVANGAEIQYTANVNSVLTVASLPVSIPAGTPIYPKLTYTGQTSLNVRPIGSIKVALKRPDQTAYGIPGVSLLYTTTSAVNVDASGPVAIARVDAEITIGAGEDLDSSDLQLITNPLSNTQVALYVNVAVASFRILRGAHGLPQRFRLFTADRALSPQLPGFVWGDYRWRTDSESNSQSIIPTVWDLDTAVIGPEKFISGIGDGADLEPVSIEKSSHSIYARVKPGFYWTGTDRYYLPSDDSAVVIDRVGADESLIFLGGSPRQQKPIFVGAMKLDHEGYYDTFVRYERAHLEFDPLGPEYQFLLDRSANTVRLNRGFTLGRLFLGLAPEASSAVFDLPVHPIGPVNEVVLGVYGDLPETPVNYQVDQKSGTITVFFDNPSSAAGRDLYVNCEPAVMVVFETKPAAPQDSVLVPVDLNPAFAGVARGYLYLEHRKKRIASIQLYCDKPRVITPQEYDMVSGLVSFGPVFYENDFAILQAVAYSFSGEPVPGARLRIVSAGLFMGSINYKDPTSEGVVVTTGGDGVASFVYAPADTFGQYLALSSRSGTDVNLPAPIPIQQLWNVDDGWLGRIYAVLNDDPFFGKKGANAEYGEIPWREAGVAGTIGYRTNGKRVLLQDSGLAIVPIAAYDSAGRIHTHPSFSGFVSKLTYSSLPSLASTGSYFLSYVGRVTLQVQAEDNLVLSNMILLDLQTPLDVVDESGVSGYLALNSGRLSVNRLGGAPIMPFTVNTPRYS